MFLFWDVGDGTPLRAVAVLSERMFKRNPFPRWLKKLKKEPLCLGPGVNETWENLWRFGIPARVTRRLKAEQVVAFFREIADFWTPKTPEESPRLVYCWHEVLTGCINICAVSDIHNGPPFGATVVDTPLEEIVRDYLASKYHDGIPLGEFRLWQEGEEEPEEQPYVLPVWSEILRYSSQSSGN